MRERSPYGLACFCLLPAPLIAVSSAPPTSSSSLDTEIGLKGKLPRWITFLSIFKTYVCSVGWTSHSKSYLRHVTTFSNLSSDGRKGKVHAAEGIRRLTTGIDPAPPAFTPFYRAQTRNGLMTRVTRNTYKRLLLSSLFGLDMSIAPYHRGFQEILLPNYVGSFRRT